MPADIVSRIKAACNEILAQPDIRKKMDELGIAVTPSTPPAFAAFVKEQVSQLAAVVKAAGVRL
jgi:tripartite-type tricarboxylate transporter receptor subunit TctC